MVWFMLHFQLVLSCKIYNFDFSVFLVWFCTEPIEWSPLVKGMTSVAVGMRLKGEGFSLFHLILFFQFVFILCIHFLSFYNFFERGKAWWANSTQRARIPQPTISYWQIGLAWLNLNWHLQLQDNQSHSRQTKMRFLGH